MAVSEVEVCNGALILLGAEKISSLSGSSKEAILCNERYSKIRDQLLSAHPWNFATYRAEIAQDADLPTDWWDWTYAHSLAADVLRVVDIEDGESRPWAVESGRKIFAYHTPVKILYIKKVTDTTLFPVYFQKALEYSLAQHLSYSLTQSASLIEQIRKDSDLAVREARSFDAQEKSLQVVLAEEYINARY